MKKENKQNVNENQQPGKKFFSARARRDFRYGSNAIILVAAVLVVFVIANLILENFGSNLTIDLTNEQLYTIGDVTDKSLKELDKDVEIVALYDRTVGQANSNSVEVIKILDLYDAYDHIEVTYQDPDRNPGLLRELVGEEQAASYNNGDYVVKCGDQTRQIKASDMYVLEFDYYQYDYKKTGFRAEQKLTSAILYVTADEHPVIYCTTGHGEKPWSQFTVAFSHFEQQGCDIQDLDLAQVKAIPEDAVVLCVLSPKEDLNEVERTMIEQWLVQEGGKLVVCADEDPAWTPLTNFNQILEENFGLSVNNDVIYETDDTYKISYANSEKAFFGVTVANGPVTVAKQPVALFSTRSIRVLSVSADNMYITNYPIMQTFSTAKSVNGLDQSENKGVQIVAAAAINNRNSKESRCAVFGSTLGLSDMYYEEYGQVLNNNIAFFDISIDWMLDFSNEGDLIQAKSYEGVANKIVLDKGKVDLLAVVSMLIIPALIIGMGVVIWVRRRHL